MHYKPEYSVTAQDQPTVASAETRESAPAHSVSFHFLQMTYKLVRLLWVHTLIFQSEFTSVCPVD